MGWVIISASCVSLSLIAYKTIGDCLRRHKSKLFAVTAAADHGWASLWVSYCVPVLHSPSEAGLAELITAHHAANAAQVPGSWRTCHGRLHPPHATSLCVFFVRRETCHHWWFPCFPWCFLRKREIWPHVLLLICFAMFRARDYR